jgi:hypothetical protein
MTTKTAAIVQAIEGYQPVDDNWLGLDALLEYLSRYGQPALAIPCLFRVFERFPAHDGHGVFWAILHLLESIPNYEAELVQSVRRQPTHFNTLMLERLICSGQTSFGGTDLRALLDQVGGVREG